MIARATLAIAFAFALAPCLATSASAQGEAPLPPWDRPVFEKEGKRVLTQIRALIKSTSKREAQVAVAGLDDSSWIVRHVATIRLNVLGLDSATTAVLRKNAEPGKKPLPANDPTRAKVAAFAAQLQPDPDPVVEDPSPAEALRIATAVITELYTRSNLKTPQRRRMIEEALSLRHGVKPKGRAWLAEVVLGWTDAKRALRDLKAKHPKAAAEKDGKPVFDWYVANRRYLYWQPHHRRLRVDLAAREAKVPSAEFRKRSPWGSEEGPNRKGSPRR